MHGIRSVAGDSSQNQRKMTMTRCARELTPCTGEQELPSERDAQFFFARCQECGANAELDQMGTTLQPIDLLSSTLLTSKQRPMGRSKDRLMTVVKWGWFGVLVLGAFGYMASGLSSGDSKSISVDSATDAATRSTNHAGDPDILGQSDTSGQVLQDWKDETQSVVGQLDQIRERQLDDQGFSSAAEADWMTICRRLSLALVGSGLSLEDIRLLEQVPEDLRETAHLRNLLTDSRFHDYWAERWTRFLVGTDEGPFVTYRRRRFRYWLSGMMAANEPYDQLVRDLITAEGLWTDKPEVNFLTVTLDSNEGSPDPVRLAARTSRAFLGLRIDCLQCHDDFLGNVSLGDVESPREGMQTDFHGLAAFYSSAEMNGLQGIRTKKEADYQYQYLDASEEVAVTPTVPYSPDLLPENGNPRERLATWVTHADNRQFSRATVSRVWALMFGRAATEAIDDLPLDEPAPPMLEKLADDFRTHYDLRRLIRTIAQSAAFRVDSRADFDISREHEDATAVFPLTRLRAEQVAGAIIQSARIKSINRDSSIFEQLQKFGSTNDFLNRYGDLGEDEFDDASITITQRLTMINGEMLSNSVNANPVTSASAHINMFARDSAGAVDSVYLCVLNRYPSGEEKEHFVARLDSADERSKAIEDLFWVLLNSTELAWNH